MANECSVFEQIGPRLNSAPIRTVPWLAATQLSVAGTATFTRSTTMISVVSTLAGGLTFTSTAGVAPDGTGVRFPIAANTPIDFDVRPGTKVRFD